MMIVLASMYAQEPQEVRCTCYLPTGNPTYDGTMPYYGICASNEEHLGDMALLYDMDGTYICMFECRDIGGNALLKSGEAIDIFQPDMESAKEWIATYGDYVQVIWVKAEG